MKFTRAEELVVKYFKAEHKRRWYVWLVVGLVNMLGGEVYGHYLEIPENAKLWLHPFRITVDEPKFRRNAPGMIHGLLVNMFGTSYREETGENPDVALNINLTEKAKAVRADYLIAYPPPEEN